MPWYWGGSVTGKEPSSGFDRIGVGEFLKDIGKMIVPMSLVASGFALWMNAKMVEVKEMIRDAVASHQATELTHFVSRLEWDGWQKLEVERLENLRKDNERQTEQIRKNTMLLERIAIKVGVKRETGD